ncbi:MAG: zinc ribbon domain-containing protein [Pedosphaera sp.]|nr:zinc ribbon domain-containing protein [Pedosphaera sp.]
MPIYEFACPKCRRVFSFLARRVNPPRSPRCPKCGNPRLVRELSQFAMIRGVAESNVAPDAGEQMPGMPALDDPKVMRAMSEIEQGMDQLDENNPRHLAMLLRKMKDVMPQGSVPKDFDVAIRRLEAGEDPEKIEADMGDVLGQVMGEEDEGGGGAGSAGGWTRDSGLYDY